MVDEEQATAAATRDAEAQRQLAEQQRLNDAYRVQERARERVEADRLALRAEAVRALDAAAAEETARRAAAAAANATATHLALAAELQRQNQQIAENIVRAKEQTAAEQERARRDAQREYAAVNANARNSLLSMMNASRDQEARRVEQEDLHQAIQQRQIDHEALNHAAQQRRIEHEAIHQAAQQRLTEEADAQAVLDAAEAQRSADDAAAAQREAQQQGDLIEEQQQENDDEVAQEILAVHPRHVTAGALTSPPSIPTALTQPIPHAYQHPAAVPPTTSDPRLQRAEQKHAVWDRPSRRD